MIYKFLLSLTCTCLTTVSFNVSAAIIDQQNSDDGTTYCMRTDCDWQQEVITGVTGLLTGIDIFLNGAATGTFQIWSGSPWQTGAALYTTSWESFNSEATYIDLSSVGMTFDVGESFTYQVTRLTGSASLMGSRLDNYAGFLGFQGADCFATCQNDLKFTTYVSAVPIPAAAWLFGSGLIGLIGLARRKASA